MPDLPPWLLGLAVQIPLVVVVTWAFTTGRIHSDAELRRGESRCAEWKRLYEQERTDRLATAERLTAALTEVREVVASVDELTREVIRNAPR